MSYYDNVIYPEKYSNIINVTKPPYNLDNTGEKDCTEAFSKILDDILSPVVKDIKKLYEALCDAPDGTWIGKSNRKMNGKVYAIHPYINQAPTIYFPEGLYLLSDTVTYRLSDLHNMMYYMDSGGKELNRCIRIMGQNRDKTIIKLKDNCKGFEKGQERSIISLMNGESSNVAMSNYVENITIDVGKGNPGAVGLKFFANNSGAVRNVHIKSSDKNFAGFAGLVIKGEHCSACNVYDLTVDGFDYGIYIYPHRTSAHFERIVINNPQKYGIKILQLAVSIIGLKANCNVPAVFASGPLSHLVLCDAEIKSKGTDFPAVQLNQNCTLIKNMKTKGFATSIERCWGDDSIKEEFIEKYTSLKEFSFGNKNDFHLDVPKMPDVSDVDFNNTAFVSDFGAKGDFDTDDTNSIQQAFNSGKETVWFSKGHYLITKTISIPKTVKKIFFNFCNIINGEKLRKAKDGAIFSIDGETTDLLYAERLFSWDDCHGEVHMFRHNSKRTVFFRDMHTQGCAFYKNTICGGEVFFENIACTIYKKELYNHISGVEINRNTCWCHGINPERSKAEVINNGGTLWWSGFKTEQEGSICVTKNGGTTEILGGVAVAGAGADIPLIENDNSKVSASFCCNGYHTYSTYPIAVMEIKNDKTNIFYDTDMPVMASPWYFCPLYFG